MTTRFRVRVLSFSNILEIEGARPVSDYAALLEAMEYGDIAGLRDDDIRDMCILSLQDMEPEEAAYLVLRNDLPDVLRDGQMRNMATEMLDEKLWEEYADSSLHERLFTVGSLLFKAFPRSFPEPDAVRATLEVTALNASAKELLTPSPDESFLVRLLADGMDSHAVLHRLYGDELKGNAFPDADQVVWIVRTDSVADDVMTIEVISSGYWLDALNETDSYESNAYADSSRTAHSS